jgi:hypothetical protein
MAKTKNPETTIAPISATASGIAAKAPADPAQKSVAPLKGKTEPKLKSEQDPAFQAMMAKIAPADDFLARDFERRRLLEILYDNADEVSNESLITWAKDNDSVLGQEFDPKDPIDVAHAQFRRKNATDRDLTARFENDNYTSLIINPRVSSQAGRDRNNPNSVIDDGFKIPAFKLNKEQARTDLARDIKTVSEMYARDAGMDAKDFAKVMGGIATIESRFGVLRSVSGTKYASSAGGAYHYLNGTIAGEVRQSMSDPRISSRVATLGVSVSDGVSKSEAWALKEDNILAGSILAKRIVETVRRNPELKNDIEALTTRVYQAHNLGDAGARALARGGRQALESLDHKADDNNPMFFKNTSSDAEVNARYRKFVAGAIASANPLIDVAFSSSPQPTVIAALKKNEPAGLLHPAPS